MPIKVANTFSIFVSSSTPNSEYQRKQPLLGCHDPKRDDEDPAREDGYRELEYGNIHCIFDDGY